MIQKISKAWDSFRSTPRISKFQQILLSSQRGHPNEIWWAVGVSALLGILYGVLIRPYWSEPVDFGQMWAGFLDYRYSPWVQSAMKNVSLQIVVPALLLKAGFNTWTLSLAASAFFCATSFAAIAAASFALTRHTIVSVALPLMLISYGFANSHGYPAEYPINYFQFGQTGQYLALFAIAMAACGSPLAAGIAGGLLSGIHAVWCVAFIVSVFPIVTWLQRPLLKRLSIAFMITLTSSLAFQFYGESLLPPKIKYISPQIPQISTLAPVTKAETSSSEKKRIRGTMLGHNVLFADADSPSKAAMIFFLPTVIFALLVIIFYFAQLKLESLQINWPSAKRLILMASIPICLAGFYKIYEEIDPQLSLFSLLDERLPALILRVIINRWLNLASLLIPVMTVGLLTMLAWEAKSWLACLGLAGILGLSVRSWYVISPSEMNRFGLALSLIVFLGVYILYLLKLKKKTEPAQSIDRGQIATVGFLFLGFFLVQFIHSAHDIYKYHRYNGKDAADPLVAIAKADRGQLIISPGVVSAQGGFNPQLRTSRPIVVPDALDVYDQNSHTIIHVFCFTDPSIPFQQFYDNVKPCFESRTAQEWSTVGRETHSTGMITPDTWKLTITPVISAGGFSYYRL